ncbi:uncharacterized protein BJ212DRAFT_1488110 [Suillus subaureus]|uniref:Uncharacterized protein n=1 Tax=Suillus subaureus TaxID=48587 RepID=A0A9P7DPU0_9AGAM|nr:uncharacterized protein BJ212DRAFT_1488110 [Suillus subaureus]KAG1800067.1 hypothetical protein BJ212DRAFT_1488110 [Suillus subaureus]
MRKGSLKLRRRDTEEQKRCEERLKLETKQMQREEEERRQREEERRRVEELRKAEARCKYEEEVHQKREEESCRTLEEERMRRKKHAEKGKKRFVTRRLPMLLSLALNLKQKKPSIAGGKKILLLCGVHRRRASESKESLRNGNGKKN